MTLKRNSQGVRRARTGRFATAAILGLALLAFLGCGNNGAPADEPDFTGLISGVGQVEGRGGTIIVNVGPEPPSDLDLVALTVSEDTVILREEGGERVPASFADLALGQRVGAWITGVVRESFPVQADARQIVILE